MKFPERDWVTDIVTTTITGAVAGAAAALCTPDLLFMSAILTGGIGGLLVGVLNIPLRYFLDKRPGPRDDEQERK